MVVAISSCKQLATRGGGFHATWELQTKLATGSGELVMHACCSRKEQPHLVKCFKRTTSEKILFKSTPDGEICLSISYNDTGH